MTAHDIVHAAQAHGVTLALYGRERILVMPPGVLPSALREAIREHRDELLTLLEAVEERAAIAQYCAGLPRPEAEARAWACILDEQGHTGCAACGYADTAGATS
jgi:hypothetical protein